MANSLEKITTDNILCIMRRKAMALEEGILSGESLLKLFGCSTYAQLAEFLKTHKNFLFQALSTGDVIPQFTKHEIIHYFEEKCSEQKRKYICSDSISPEELL